MRFLSNLSGFSPLRTYIKPRGTSKEPETCHWSALFPFFFLCEFGNILKIPWKSISLARSVQQLSFGQMQTASTVPGSLKNNHHIMSLHREMIYWYNTDIHVHKCPYSKLPALPTQMNAKDLAESLKLALQASCSEAIVALRNKASGQSLFSPANAIWYCWWQKLIGSFSHYLQGLYIPGGAGFQPSTVA